jgi:alpha-methylacyl-CoA racemase
VLDGLTVLDLASVGPAARTSRWLADYGARVVKVGPPPKQSGVQIVPPFYAYSGHRGMERVLLDLKSDGGRDAFLKLAAHADVVIESFRPGVMARLGLGYDDVKAVNPRIVYCSTSGYGQTGPRSQWAGHDINYLAVGGYLDCSGRDTNGGPALPGATIGDAAGGGMQAVIAILAALVQRNASNAGAYLDVSVADGVIALMSLYIDEYFATGEVPGPRHNILTGRYACYDVYECSDGEWLAVGAIEPHFYKNLCNALGCDEWIPFQTDDARQDEIRAAFRAAFKAKPRDEWVTTLGPANTCVSEVASVPELVNDEHLRARHAFVPTNKNVEQVGWVLAGQPAQAEGEMRDATLTDTDALLQEVGYSAAEIAALKQEGVAA